ncbi:signal peptide containing protein [Cryptosporidium canis]|uniref:Signal peptide containing protein n=1 Tax=Cryptosporidium canis TaxID=195482 RepID=A0A9D5HWS4_9CRYT|nr:signal peptide containing protein [Cryptosporidium canis]
MKNNFIFFICIIVATIWSPALAFSNGGFSASRIFSAGSIKLDGLLASKEYFLLDPAKFWSHNSTTQVETKAPISRSEFLVVNAPSIGIEELIFIKNEKDDGTVFYSHKLHSFLTYTLECTKIGRVEGWVLRQPASDIAYGFLINSEDQILNNCKRSLMPYELEKWYNSLNQQIRDMFVTQIWIT